jgi:hypothetical protein
LGGSGRKKLILYPFSELFFQISSAGENSFSGISGKREYRRILPHHLFYAGKFFFFFGSLLRGFVKDIPAAFAYETVGFPEYFRGRGDCPGGDNIKFVLKFFQTKKLILFI